MRLITALLVVVLTACGTEKANLSSWMGSTKHDIILKWGTPESTESDGGNGEVLIYRSRNGLNGPYVYRYRMMYADSAGILYHWKWQDSNEPPTIFVVR